MVKVKVKISRDGNITSISVSVVFILLETDDDTVISSLALSSMIMGISRRGMMLKSVRDFMIQ